MSEPKELYRFTNSENEVVTIHRIQSTSFQGQLLLIIWDDPPPKGTGRKAPTLLTPELAQSLIRAFKELELIEND